MPENVPVMYGIPNCDTIKKARKWLTQHNIDYQFHDYKKLGTDELQLQNWLQELGWEQLINKRGTTWRKLDEKTKSTMDNQAAIKVMQDNPSIFKRPLLILQDQNILGFNENTYTQELLQA